MKNEYDNFPSITLIKRINSYPPPLPLPRHTIPTLSPANPPWWMIGGRVQAECYQRSVLKKALWSSIGTSRSGTGSSLRLVRYISVIIIIFLKYFFFFSLDRSTGLTFWSIKAFSALFWLLLWRARVVFLLLFSPMKKIPYEVKLGYSIYQAINYVNVYRVACCTGGTAAEWHYRGLAATQKLVALSPETITMWMKRCENLISQKGIGNSLWGWKPRSINHC